MGLEGLVVEDIVFSSPLCKNKTLLEVGDPWHWMDLKITFLQFPLGQKTVKIQFWRGWYMQIMTNTQEMA